MGRRNIARFLLTVFATSWVKAFPIIGRSPKKGILLVANSCCSTLRPPMAIVSPSVAEITVEICRLTVTTSLNPGVD